MKEAIIKGHKVFHSIRKKLFPNLSSRSVPFANTIIAKIMSIKVEEINTFWGDRFILDDLDSLELSYSNSFEKEESVVFENFIKEGMFILDIGANIGYHTLYFCKLCGPKGKVIAFEPDPQNFRILTKNIEINGYTNVESHNLGVGTENKKGHLAISNNNTAGNSIVEVDKASEEIETVSIEIVKLDDFLPKDQKIDFIKIDIEGYEPFAFHGMKQLLRKQEKLGLLIEFCPSMLRDRNISPNSFLTQLQEIGFRIYETDKKREITNDRIDEFVINCTHYANLIGAKGDLSISSFLPS